MVSVFHLDAVAVAYIEVSAAFDYQFGALDRKQDELREILDESTYANVFLHYGCSVHVFHNSSGSLGNATKLDLLLQYGIEWLPTQCISLFSHLRITKFSHLRAAGTRLSKIAEQLVKEKTDAFMDGSKGENDVMSLLVRANAQEKQSARLSDSEVISQISYVTCSMAGEMLKVV
jgi:hypothetical protein